MKLLHIKWGHPRNVEFIIRACKLYNIEYHYTDESSPRDINYDIIWAPSEWIDPDHYPNSKIIFGPHFWVFPNKHDPLFTRSTPEHAKRCIYLTLSDWNKDVFNEFIPVSEQIIPFVPLPFGLDIKALTKSEHYEYDCIIYYKDVDPVRVSWCISCITSIGLRYKLYHYGSYDRDEYLSTLQKTRFVIWLGRHESQGFGLEECLATNTPIYVYDVKTMKEEYVNGRYIYLHHSEQLLATAAPYWSDSCGIKVYSDEEFVSRLPEFMEMIPQYEPAKYV
jgi:glycosyltransferase involved in cell wall biosynthesis